MRLHSRSNLAKRWPMLALLVLFAYPAVAQIAPPPALSETLDVRVVNLEAVVKDADGLQVPGLGLQDFRLRVDGEEMPIGFFTEIRDGTAVNPADATAEQVPTLPPGERLGTSFLVFIDEMFALPADKNRVLRELRDELSLGPADRMAIVAWDGGKLAMLSSWSQNQRALVRVLEQAIERPADGLRRWMDMSRFDIPGASYSRLLYRRHPIIDRYHLTLEERAYAEQLRGQLERTVDAAVQTLTGFAAPPGRKVMLVLSGGWPFDVAQYTAGDRRRLVVEPGLGSPGALVRPLAETANLLGYTLYPVDVPGFQASGTVSAERSRSLPLFAGQLDDLRELEIHDSLRLLADETGGRALINSQRDKALSLAIEDTRSFYWLGFTPEWLGDDQPHRISLEILRPGLSVRARRNFLDLSTERRVSMRLASALAFGHPAGTQRLEVAFGDPKPAGRQRIEVPVTVSLPLDALVLLPTGDGHAGDLALHVAVVDDQGNRSEMSVIPLALLRDHAPAAGEQAAYHTTLRLRRRPHEVIVALYDQLGGTLFATTTSIKP